MEVTFDNTRSGMLVQGEREVSDYDFRVYWRRIIYSEGEITAAFLTRDGYYAERINLCDEHPDFPVICGHEIGHVLDSQYMECERYNKFRHHTIRVEMRAWRVAKAIVKPRLWKKHRGDYHCKQSLYGYLREVYSIEQAERILDKLKIIPLVLGSGY